MTDQIIREHYILCAKFLKQGWPSMAEQRSTRLRQQQQLVLRPHFDAKGHDTRSRDVNGHGKQVLWPCERHIYGNDTRDFESVKDAGSHDKKACATVAVSLLLMEHGRGIQASLKHTEGMLKQSS